ncbi:MAG: thioredoxin fold domain-containing protein [Balneolaceae bacterium]
MRRKLVIVSVVTAFAAVFLYFSLDQITPREIENAPEWMDLDTALAQARAEPSDKLILIDIYEVGCRFCRQMEREVYPSESIRTLLDNNFYPVKVNGNSGADMVFNNETMTEQEFAARMGVSAFPFTVVMDPEGNVVNSRRGYMGVVDLSRFLNNTLEGG